MKTVTYKKFIDNFPSFGASLHPVYNTNPSVHEHNAELLHSLYCILDDCTWDEEEELLAPWTGHDHLFWANMSEKFEEAGISMRMAMQSQKDVLALIGIEIY